MAAAVLTLAEAGLPSSLTLVVAKRAGLVRHVRKVASSAPGVRTPLTWCNMFWDDAKLRIANREEDAELPICGACLRTADADLWRQSVTAPS